jgi:NTE family protein
MSLERKLVSERKLITDICLAGACNRGIGYIGAIKKLESESLLQIKKMVGSSIGSFICACYIIGYSSDELFDEVYNKNLSDFKDYCSDEPVSILRGQEYRNWIYKVISVKENPYISLSDLYKKTGIDFTLTASCVYSSGPSFKEGLVYLNHLSNPEMPLYTALNCSMAFPFVFPPVDYEGCKFIDGGLLDNFPIHLISKEYGVGIMTSSKKSDNSMCTDDPFSYTKKMVELIIEKINESKEQYTNVMIINCRDFDILNFDQSPDDKLTLYKRGYDTMEKYLKINHSGTVSNSNSITPSESITPPESITPSESIPILETNIPSAIE